MAAIAVLFQNGDHYRGAAAPLRRGVNFLRDLQETLKEKS